MGRATMATMLLAGVTLATGAVQAGATISVTWGSFAFPGGFSDHDDPSQTFAVDYAGNIYTAQGGTGIQVYSPSTTNTYYLDSGHNFSGFSGLAVSSDGTVYVSEGSTVYQVSSGGAESVVTTALASPEALAVDPSGNLYIYDDTSGNIYEMVFGTPVLIHSVPVFVNSMAAGNGGDLYIANYGNTVDEVTTTGVTPVGSGWSEAESVAVDGAGNVYVADENATSLIEVPASGSQDVLTATATSDGCGDQVSVGGPTLFYTDECSSNVFTIPVTPLAQELIHPTLLGVVTSDETVPGPLTQTITASWLGVPGAVSYTCTLMYGFTSPSDFTVTTPSHTCSFVGLSPTTEFGVQVVANGTVFTSAPAVGFAAPPAIPVTTPPPVKHTIVCKKNHSTAVRAFTKVHPTCPVGWHRVA